MSETKYKTAITDQLEALDAIRIFFRTKRLGDATVFNPVMDITGKADWSELTGRVIRSFNLNELFEKRIDSNYLEEEILLKTVEFSYKDQFNEREDK